MPKTVAIVQARMGSSRLPKKIVMDVCGKTMLERVIEGVKKSNVDEVIIASPDHIQTPETLFIGDEEDVLKRYYDCATAFGADIIVRVTADCPLIDSNVINMALDFFHSHEYPFVYFAPVDGLDVEVFSYEMLSEAHFNAPKDMREHVTTYMRLKTKVSVDTLEDLCKVRNIWSGKTR